MQEMQIYGVSFDLVGKQPIVLLKTSFVITSPRVAMAASIGKTAATIHPRGRLAQLVRAPL